MATLPSTSLTNPEDDNDYYCFGCGSYDHPRSGYCSKLHCTMCDKIGHLFNRCPWHIESVPPGTVQGSHFTVLCKYCHGRICYLDSVHKRQKATGCAVFKYCVRCYKSKDHETPMCSSVIKDRLCHNADFDPLKHTSFYVENLPGTATALDLYGHFYDANYQGIDNVAVHPDKNTGKCLGYVRFEDPEEAFNAFKWGNGTGSLFGSDGDEIKCHPYKI